MPQKQEWKNKKVLVTGHTGFKGSWLSLWLKQKKALVSGISLLEPVSNPDMFSILNLKNELEDFRGDITSFNYCLDRIKKIDPEIIFHMAAQPIVRKSYNQPLLTYKTNVIGTANVLEAARSCKSIKAIVVITSDKCYNNVEKNYSYIETDSLGGYDPYSSSKACAEHVASAYYQSFFKEKSIGIATARAGNVIGGGDWSLDRLIPDTVKNWSKNQKVMIRFPNAIRPWQHVLEPLSGYLILAQMLRKDPQKFSVACNFGPDNLSEKTVAETVSQLASVWNDNANYEISQNNHPHEASFLQLNNDKAKSLLGWKPCMNFEKTIFETILWYKKYYNNNTNLKDFTLKQIKEYENISGHA